MSLEPIEPETALELFLKNKEAELAEASIKGHDCRLQHFVRWCHEQGIENLNTLTGRQLHEYRLWRRDDGDLNKVSEKAQMDSLRSFVRWLEAVDGVEQDLSEKVLAPTITADENSRDVMLDSEHASSVLSHLEKYEYAGPQHVSITMMWHTMMRGGVHAIDVDDYNPDEQYVKVRHGADTGSRSRTSATARDSSSSRTTSVNYSTTGWTISDPRRLKTTAESRYWLLVKDDCRIRRSGCTCTGGHGHEFMEKSVRTTVTQTTARRTSAMQPRSSRRA